MNNAAAALAEMPAAPAPEPARKGRSREGRGARRPSQRARSNTLERYFLATGQSGENVAIGRELSNEQEALVAAFQEKVTFFVVTEYRVDTQFKGASALLVKEGVSRPEA